MNKDPITAHYGYPALLEQLTQANATKPKAIALLSIESQHNSDLQLGVTDSKKRHNSQLNALALKLDAKTFYIRPGLFALSFTRLIDGQWLEDECRALFHTDSEEPSLRIGLLNLPLMANVDIKIDAVTHFEVLQMALYGARSLPDAACAYVSFKTLDFAPVSIFNQPLFLHLSKAIERGLVRVDTSGNKDAIQWPQAEID